MTTATGTFEVELSPEEPELGGVVSRFRLSKTFQGDLRGTGTGVMLSCGDPQAGSAGYVAIETVDGQLGSTHGSFVLQQLGIMHNGAQTLHYVVAPGSGRDGLENITGTFSLTIDEAGGHSYVLEYEL